MQYYHLVFQPGEEVTVIEKPLAVMEPSVWKTIQSSLPGVSKLVAYRSSSLPVSAAKPVSSLGVRPYPM
ncbi:hypothetical protein HOLleu_44277 [Holothuria leucospilota]|uniref:Uncharacterized protein n=1 Tax=Holothuria leucospilota TaxID=206669 RepID=A0A9Q0YCM3_HOLLE|nr:hypothetical protein HOLleu_44277 [Holothuria leucospilota]